MRREFYIGVAFVIALNILAYFYFPGFLWSLVFFGPIIAMGTYDVLQTKHVILRNFPVIGHFRYWLENIRPEINQYFIESNTDGVPFNREERSIVYQRAKKTLDTLPFGTQRNVYELGYEWFNHSLQAFQYENKDFRVTVGGPDCKQPYSASIFNISAMSYGSLSQTAIEAMSGGAKLGNFAHNTGEGGVSPYHLKGGGDLIWQIGTGYFGCRDDKGNFCAENFQKNASQEQVKMIEIKLSQRAKPGHGGILPSAKVTPEIAKIRLVPLGKDIVSPPSHSAFSTPIEMMEFIAKLRELSGGKPVGFKLCVGKRREFAAICKAMVETGITPDFITVDGGEGGTGAAPLEFSNSIGCPLREGLIFVRNCIVGFGLRKRIKIIASGKVIHGKDLVARLCLGADLCYSARGMMMATGCIQALRCNSNSCPTGVATQDPALYRGINVNDKKVRVANYHRETVKSAGEIMGAMGVSDPSQLRPWHLMRRIGFNEVRHYGELYTFLSEGELLQEKLPKEYERCVKAATPLSFKHVDDMATSA